MPKNMTFVGFKKGVLSIARMCGLTKPSETNRFPIADILSFMSVEMVFNRLSNVRLLGKYDSTTDNPQAFIILLCCMKSMERKNDVVTCLNQV